MDRQRNDRLGRNTLLQYLHKQRWQILRANRSTSNAYANTDAMHGQMYAYAEAASHAGTTPVAGRWSDTHQLSQRRDPADDDTIRFFENDIRAALRHCPKCVQDWLQCAEDERTQSGRYFTQVMRAATKRAISLTSEVAPKGSSMRIH